MEAQDFINKAAETREIVASLARELAGAKVPEFSNEEMTVADTALLTGLPEGSVRMGIIYGWFPVGVATRDGQKVTEYHPGNRANYIIFPRKVWEVTGHVWRGKAALAKGGTS